MKDVKQELKNELIDRLFKDVDIIKANTLIDGLIEKNSVPIRVPARGNINNVVKVGFIEFCKMILGKDNKKLKEYQLQMIEHTKGFTEGTLYFPSIGLIGLDKANNIMMDEFYMDVKNMANPYLEAREPDDGDINKMSKTQLKRLIRDYKGDIDKRNRYNELKKELKNRR